VIALLGYISGIGSLLTDAGMQPSTVKVLLALCGIVSGMLSTINAVLSGIPAKDNSTGFIIKGPHKDGDK